MKTLGHASERPEPRLEGVVVRKLLNPPSAKTFKKIEPQPKPR